VLAEEFLKKRLKTLKDVHRRDAMKRKASIENGDTVPFEPTNRWNEKLSFLNILYSTDPLPTPELTTVRH